MRVREKTLLVLFVFLIPFVFPKHIFSFFNPKECGRIFPIDSYDNAERMEKCAQEAMEPFVFKKKKSDWWSLCRFSGIPVPFVGDLFATLCHLRKDSEEIAGKLLPWKVRPAAPSPPQEKEASPQALREEGREKRGILAWLIETIGRFVGGRRGHVSAFLPWSLEREKGAFFQTAASKEKDEIIAPLYTFKKAILPFELVPAHGRLPLPPEIEPTPTPLPSGVPTPTPLPPGAPTPTLVPSGKLWYRIEHRDTSVVVSSEKREEITSLVLKYWPRSLIDEAWGYVEQRAIENGWNPSFVIALWIEESGASGVSAWDVGCTGAPKNDLQAGLDCLFGLPYGDKDFPEFLCRFSEGHYPCQFLINPNFPKNLKAWYDRLVPPGTPGGARPL